MSMSLKENLHRIRTQRELSQDQLAAAAGVSQQLISRLERGVDATTKKLPAIARALDVQVEELDENFILEQSATVLSVPEISMVSAGDFLKSDAVDMNHVKHVQQLDLDPSGRWVALIVDGDSMDRISPPGSTVFVNLRDRRLVPNACYVIQDQDGGASYKRFRTNPDRWEAVSTNPTYEPYFVEGDNGPKVFGRVRRTVLKL